MAWNILLLLLFSSLTATRVKGSTKIESFDILLGNKHLGAVTTLTFTNLTYDQLTFPTTLFVWKVYPSTITGDLFTSMASVDSVFYLGI